MFKICKGKTLNKLLYKIHTDSRADDW